MDKRRNISDIERYTQVFVREAGHMALQIQPWALTGFGFRAVIAASFADIFRNNALKNGLLPVEVEAEVSKELARLCQETSDVCLVIDLEGQTISLAKISWRVPSLETKAGTIP